MKILPLLLLVLCLLPATAQDIRLGLVAYWPLDVVSPDELTTPDVAPSQSALTLVNMDSSNVIPGMRGNAITFNGIDELMFADTGIAGSNAGLPLQNNLRKTICLWVRAIGSTQRDVRFFAEASMAANAPMYNLGTDSATTGSTGKLDVYIRSDANAAPVNHAKSVGEPFNGTWRHLAVTDNNGVVRYYVDGVLDAATLTYTRPVMTLDSLSLGGIRRLSGNVQLFNGALDDVAVWNRILSPAEIQQVMNNGLVTPVPPLVTTSRQGPLREGDHIRLSVQYPGLELATFQWQRNGANLSGATESTYVIPALSAANQGNYSVILNGNTPADTVSLTFIPDPAASPGTNLVSWWPFDSLNETTFPFTTPDPWGGHPLSCFDLESMNLVPGKFGSAMEFDGFSEIAYRASGFPVSSAPEYSVAFWVKAEGTAQADLRVFAEGSDASNTPLVAIGTSNNGSDRLRMYVRSDSNTVAVDALSETPVFDDTWRHVVWTDRNGQGRLYVDGMMDGVNFSYNRTPLVFTLNQTSVGGIKRLAPSHWCRSTMDDVAIWNRALTWTEVQSLMASGVPAPVSAVPPEVTVHPLSRTVWEGRAVSLSIQATGTAPFTYQWRRNGDPVPDSDAPTLLLDPAEAKNSGVYTCRVTNSADSAISDPAAVVVRAINGLDSGRISTWPLEAGEGVTPDILSSHDLTLSNLDPAIAWQPGVNNNGIRLDGTDDLLARTRTGLGSDIPLTTREEFTLAFWVRGSAIGQNDRRVFAEGSIANNQPLFNMGTHNIAADGTDKLYFYIRGDAGGVPVGHQASTAPVFDTYWHHVIYTDYRGQGQLYVDGVPDLSLNYTRPVSTLNTISLGGIARAAASHWFGGSIDEVNTWERAITSGEASAYFASQPKPPPTLEISGIAEVDPGHWQLRVATSHGNANYGVQATNNLETGPWVNADEALIGAVAHGVLTVDLYPPVPGRRYYRVFIP